MIDLVLCHYPIFSWKNKGKGTLLLYGHTHNNYEDEYYQKCLSLMTENECRHINGAIPRAINVGCMKPWMGYEPRTLKESWNTMEAVCCNIKALYGR